MTTVLRRRLAVLCAPNTCNSRRVIYDVKMTDASSRSAPAWLAKPNFRDDLFRGAAEFYALYRPPYPAVMFDDLLTRAGIGSGGRLLDLACGTGEIAIPLHDRFREVWAVDLESEMVEVGQRKASELGADNIRWSSGKAEDLDAPEGSFQLITVGNAFHRLDRPLVAAKALTLLSDGGCIAVMGSNSVWTGAERWQAVATEVIQKWTDHPGRADKPADPGDTRPRLTHEQALLDAGFHDVVEYQFPTPYVWTLETFMGYLYSTSVAAKARQADAADEFEKELRDRLLEIEPSGQFEETAAFYYILGRRS